MMERSAASVRLIERVALAPSETSYDPPLDSAKSRASLIYKDESRELQSAKSHRSDSSRIRHVDPKTIAHLAEIAADTMMKLTIHDRNFRDIFVRAREPHFAHEIDSANRRCRKIAFSVPLSFSWMRSSKVASYRYSGMIFELSLTCRISKSQYCEFAAQSNRISEMLSQRSGKHI